MKPEIDGEYYYSNKTFLTGVIMMSNFSDECLWDIFICYNPEESSNLVANFLLPKIENELGYSCFAFERDSLGGECKYTHYTYVRPIYSTSF
jgi:hypothetical protein